jgi:SulP family sulfate permease
MVLFGALRLGKLIRMVPHPVMLGFVNGLAIVIATAQLAHFRQSTPQGEAWLHGSALAMMCGLVALTMLIVYVLPRVTRAAPPALVAIVGVGVFAQLLHLPTRTLGDMAHIAGGLPGFNLPDVPLNLETLQVVLPYAVLIAIVGLLETLLTFNLTDEITETRGQPNRECLALGAANIASGLFGGMGGCAMIGQTMINLNSGGRSRLSGIVSGVMILMYILFLSPLIERIPLAALVGVMFVVAQQTFAWGSLRVLGKVPRNDALVIIAVTLITVFSDLAIAVLCGIVIAALNFAWQHAREIHAHVEDRADNRTYVPRGTLFFASTARFHELFDPQQDPADVTIDCSHLLLADHSALAALQGQVGHLTTRPLTQHVGRQQKLRRADARSHDDLRALHHGGIDENAPVRRQSESRNAAELHCAQFDRHLALGERQPLRAERRLHRAVDVEPQRPERNERRIMLSAVFFITHHDRIRAVFKTKTVARAESGGVGSVVGHGENGYALRRQLR